MKKIYLLAALVFLASSLSGQTDWIKHPENPVLQPGVEGEWDEGALTGGSVIFHNDTFRTWYSRGHFATTDPYIGYATSLDGIHWTKYGDNPVLVSGPVESWDGYKLVFPTVLIRDMVYHMWYIGQPHESDFHEYKIGHAISADGIHWEKDSENPVLEKGPEGSPDANYIFFISAVHDDSLFHLWYGANNGVDNFVYTCHATSQDGTTWSKDPENPVLTGGSWDNPMCMPGTVYFDGSDFHMWYTGGDPTTRRVGYATSADGTAWVKQSESPVLTGGQPGEWDEGPVTARGIMYDHTNTKYKMWYTCGAFGVGFAESSVPEGIFINSHFGTDPIKLYPNPVTNLLNVRTGLSEDHLIEIASLNGQIVYSMTMDRPGYEIDLSALERGIYFITIRSKDFVATRKIIKLT